MNLPFDFSVNKNNNTIVVKREFNAPVSDVWDAWTVAELLDQWWAPKPWRAKTKKMDFRAGGQRLYAMLGPQGEEHWALADYETVSPKINFTHLDGFCDSDGNLNPDFPRSHWNIYFSESGDHTAVNIVISYKQLSDLEMIIQFGFKEGFTIAMQGLDELFASGF